MVLSRRNFMQATLGVIATLEAIGASGVLEGCSSPQPGSDAGNPFVTTVGNILAWAYTQLTSLQNAGLPAPIPSVVSVALQEVTAAQNALTAYVNGTAGGICPALGPAVVAVVDALVGVLSALQAANVTLPSGLIVGVEATGTIVSQIVGVACPITDAGTLAATRLGNLPAAASGYTPGSLEYLRDLCSSGHAPLHAPIAYVTIPANLICPPVPR